MAGWGVGDDLHEGKDRAQSQAFANFKIKIDIANEVSNYHG
jgi:hypothetical protein